MTIAVITACGALLGTYAPCASRAYADPSLIGAQVEDGEQGTPDSETEKGQIVEEPTQDELLARAKLTSSVYVAGTGWTKPVKAGKTAGTYSSKGIRRIKVSLDNFDKSLGSIRYEAYVEGKGWKSAKDGASCGSSKRNVKAVRVRLTGAISKKYAVYYRVYVRGYKWLDWTKGNKAAGTTKLSLKINAMQVKLVKKGAKFKGKTATPLLNDKWKALEFKYRSKASVKQLLQVKYTGGSNARVVLRKKKGLTWRTALSCKGYVGRAGIGKAREYLARTPEGDFGITSAFGILNNPGAKLPYVKVTQEMYWCSDRECYNQLININEHPHYCTGEHLIDCRPYYNYGLFFDYNTNPIRYGKGSAFFVHCMGSKHSTDGCITVSQGNMIKIIRNVSSGARLCIYPK